MKEIIGAAIIGEQGVLLVDNRGNWSFPGGTLELEESDAECLRREFAEEFSGSNLVVGNLYQIFEGTSPRRKDPIKVRIYFAQTDETFRMPDGSDDDIKRAAWIRFPEHYTLSEVSREIFDSLRNDQYIL